MLSEALLCVHQIVPPPPDPQDNDFSQSLLPLDRHRCLCSSQKHVGREEAGQAQPCHETSYRILLALSFYYFTILEVEC